MNNWVKLFFLLLALAYMLISIKHVLHMFQQNRYELPRYTGWLKQRRYDYQDVVVGLIMAVIWLIPLFFRNALVIMLYLLLFCTLKLALEWKIERNKNYIKPLKYTGRVKRQAAVILILNIIWLLLWMRLPVSLWPLALIVAFYVNWLLIYVVYYLTQPLENLIKRYYLDQARQILQNSPSLKKIGITGSYGKTSTKNIVNAVLADQYYTLMTPASYNTPMGITITIRELLKPLHEVFICEMGADKVGEIDFLTKFVRPQYGIVTSIGPQHLNTFHSLENIIQEKMCMIENLPEDGIGFLNMDNEYIRQYHVHNACRLISYGIHDQTADYRAAAIEYSPYGSHFKVLAEGQEWGFATKLLGEHNIMNILVAVALGRTMGISWEKLQKTIKDLDYIEHRLQLKKINGLTFIDNAFNSNPAGAAMSLDVLSRMPGKRIIITPGMIDLGQQQDQANRTFGRQMLGKADHVILVGKRQTAAILAGLSETGFDESQIKVVDTVKEAFGYVYQIADGTDTILLENDLPDAFNN
ncbi:MAG: UDP-N-acetylmuramoyl-tripeptide--D-alanyl-D-alanine ligase [Erysipelotrichaceae bacterium]|nr:UDP-N-acetylmuramoyl-tripeptide--D-alanyl-D-alanine ligase [Erysipelotrichaceae bacterium]